MKKLKDLVTVGVNNEDCVILNVKPDATLDLIRQDCFNGDEVMLRLTKGKQHVCTVWYGDDFKHYSWVWGKKGYTLVTERLKKLGNLIQSCIQDDFHINMEE
jgi:hypothetical protein